MTYGSLRIYKTKKIIIFSFIQKLFKKRTAKRNNSNKNTHLAVNGNTKKFFFWDWKEIKEEEKKVNKKIKPNETIIGCY